MRIACGLVALTLAACTLEALPARQHTRPQVPSPETLRHLGLKKRWHVYLPIAGLRDHISFIQVIDDQLVAQTASAGLIVINVETGATQWEMRTGEAFRTTQQEVAANDRMFFVVAGAKLRGIDRDSARTEWTFDLPAAPAAPPVSDAFRLFLVSGTGRIHGFLLPLSQRDIEAREIEEAKGEKAKSEKIPGGTTTYLLLARVKEPDLLWSVQSEALITVPPVLTSRDVVFADAKGAVFSYLKDDRVLQERLRLPEGMATPMGQLGDTIYVPCIDTNLYAFDMERGRFVLRWRFTVGSPIVTRPNVIGDDLYVASSAGLHCLDRETGEGRWQQPQAHAFIAASKRLVFASDRLKRTLILDRQKGRVLGVLDTRDFAYRVVNETSDRLILANHDGLVVCLEDIAKEDDKPLYHNLPPKMEEPAEKEPAKDKEMPKEKDKPEDKEKPKEKEKKE